LQLIPPPAAPGIPQDFVLAYLWSSLAAAHAGKLADESAAREYKVEAEDAIDAQNPTRGTISLRL
jgi:hypothetical protein